VARAGVDESLELRLRPEVEQETDLVRCGAQITHELRSRKSRQRFGCFALDDDLFVDDEVESLPGHNTALESDLNWHFPGNVMPSVSELELHCATIRGFDQPKAKVVVNHVERADDRVTEFRLDKIWHTHSLQIKADQAQQLERESARINADQSRMSVNGGNSCRLPFLKGITLVISGLLRDLL
jgi:hypothetical protein